MAACMFSDLNLLQQNEYIENTIHLAIKLGYERVAINVCMSLKAEKGKKQKDKEVVPPPAACLLNEASQKLLQLKSSRFEQLSRITARLEDAANTHKLASPDFQAYDIIAVQPTNEKTFQLACSTLDIDIISLNLTENLDFSVRRPLLNLAAERGIYFELVYSPALRSTDVKRTIISNALKLLTVGGGKNIIISSASEKPIELRSPLDVMNLGMLFGLTQWQAKDAISKNCRAVLMHAASRRTCKTVVSVMKASSLQPKDQWLLNNLRSEKGKHQSTDDGVDDGDEKEEEELSSNEEGSDDSMNESLPQKKRRVDAS